MLGMSTCGLRFLPTFLAVSVMYQVVLLSTAESGFSFGMSGWKKRGYRLGPVVGVAKLTDG